MNQTIQKQINIFAQQLEQLSDTELVQKFNREVGITGWTSTRSAYLAALRNSFEKRGIDYSAVGDGNALSLKQQVVLNNMKLEIIA